MAAMPGDNKSLLSESAPSDWLMFNTPDDVMCFLVAFDFFSMEAASTERKPIDCTRRCRS